MKLSSFQRENEVTVQLLNGYFQPCEIVEYYCAANNIFSKVLKISLICVAFFVVQCMEHFFLLLLSRMTFFLVI